MYFAGRSTVANSSMVQRGVGLVLAAVLLVTGLAFTSASAQPASTDTGAADSCSVYHRFGAKPVDVAKTADNQTVLAQASWRWHDSIGCYLVLDNDAVVALRAAGPPENLPQGQTEASRHCSTHHRFGAEPVDVAKTADNQTVLARLSWGFNSSIGCYLVLDPAATNTLRAAETPPATAPDTPTDLTATPGNGQITIEWTAPADNGGAITQYSAEFRTCVQKAIDGNSCQQWSDFWLSRTTTSTPPGTTLTIPDLVNGTLFQLRVRALNTVGYSPYSTTATATPMIPPSAPDAPANLTATPGNGQITVSWTAPADNGAAITGYTVAYKATSSACPSTLDSSWSRLDASGTSATISNLTNGTAYRLCVNAANQVGDSAWATVSATPAATPGAPGNVTATGGDSQITVTWDAAPSRGTPVTAYTIQRCDAADRTCTGGWANVGTTAATRFALSNLADGTTHGIRVRATNANGPGDWSTTAFASTTAFSPGTPSELTATPGSGYITLSWGAPDSGGSPITGYTVECRLSASGRATGYCNSASWTSHVTISDTSITVGRLTNGTSYDLRVRANNRVGSSEWTSVTATPANTPNTPTGLEIEISGRNIEVNWNAPASGGSPITSYTVQYCTGSCTSWSSKTVTGDPPPTSTTLTGLRAGSVYRVRVGATNAAGDSRWSASSSDTTTSTPDAPTITGFTAYLEDDPDTSDTVVPRFHKLAVVEWTAPASDGGSEITGYNVALCVGTNTTCTDTRGSWRTATTASSSPAILTNLNASTLYYVRVRAVNAAGPSDWSGILQDATPAATEPDPPTFLRATPENRRIKLQWSAPRFNGLARITSYTVAYYEYKDTGSSKNCPNTDDGSWTSSWTRRTTSSTSYTFSNLNNGKKHALCVLATNSVGSSGWNTGTDAAVVATPATTPSAPANFTATPGDNRISLEWSAPASGGQPIRGYTVEVKHGSGNWFFAAYVESPTTSIDLADYTNEPGDVYNARITNGTTYGVRVRTDTSIGTSTWSSKTVHLPKTPAGSLSASRNRTKGELQLDWVVYNPGPNRHSFEPVVAYTPATTGNCPTRSKENPIGWTIPTVSNTSSHEGNLTTYKITISSLEDNTTYRFCVRDKSDGAPSGSEFWSVTVSAKTPSLPGRPAAPTLVAGNGKLTASWTAPSDNGTDFKDYDVQIRVKDADPHESGDQPGEWSTDRLGSSDSTVVTVEITEYSSGVNLVNGTAYQVQVRAANDLGESDWSPIATATPAKPATKPTAPAQPTLTPGDRKITVEWAAPADNGASITDYDVQYRSCTATDRICQQSPTWSSWTVKSFSGSGTSTTITSLVNGTAYQVQVRAQNSAGESDWSSSATAKPDVKPVTPAAPTLTASNGTLTVSWKAPSNNGTDISDYDVQYRVKDTNPHDGGDQPGTWSDDQLNGGSTSTALTAKISSLTNGTAYQVQVRAQNAAGESGWSGSATGTPAAIPATPSAPTLTRGDRKITVNWAKPADNGSRITDYDVRYSTDGLTWSAWSHSGTSLKATITGLVNGTEYSVQVRAQNSQGESGWSTSATATPNVVPGTPATPTLTAGDGTLTVSWTAPTNNGTAILGYQVAYCDTSTTCDPDPNNWSSTKPGADDRSADLSLTNDTTYRVRIRANNAAGNSSWSGSATGTPAAIPATPSAPTLTRGDRKITVNWAKPADNGSRITDYDVRYSTDGLTWSAWSHSGTSLKATITGLVNGTEYSVQVRAQNSQGESGWSTSATATPNVVPGTPATPTLTAGDGTLTVSWTAPTNNGTAILGYQVAYCDTSTTCDPDPNNWSSTKPGADDRSADLSLTNDTTYRVRIRANNAAGNSSWSGSATGTPRASS